MKRIILILLTACLISGCDFAAKNKNILCPNLQQLTPITCMEVHTEWLRSYYYRYPNGTAILFNMGGKVFEIEGIQFISNYRYGLTVTIGKAYSWDEIQPQIIKLALEFEHAIPELKKQVEEMMGVAGKVKKKKDGV